MGAFSKDVILPAESSLIPVIAGEIEKEFLAEGYEVKVDSLLSGACDVSITKGGMFKAVLGMRTALKINLTPLISGIQLKADVGIWGQQAVPFAISMLLFWPVLLTQIWGLISQAKLDDKAVDIANRTIILHKSTSQAGNRTSVGVKVCPSCGRGVADSSAVFCPNCGSKL